MDDPTQICATGSCATKDLTATTTHSDHDLEWEIIENNCNVKFDPDPGTGTTATLVAQDEGGTCVVQAKDPELDCGDTMEVTVVKLAFPDTKPVLLPAHYPPSIARRTVDCNVQPIDRTLRWELNCDTQTAAIVQRIELDHYPWVVEKRVSNIVTTHDGSTSDGASGHQIEIVAGENPGSAVLKVFDAEMGDCCVNTRDVYVVGVDILRVPEYLFADATYHTPVKFKILGTNGRKVHLQDPLEICFYAEGVRGNFTNTKFFSYDAIASTTVDKPDKNGDQTGEVVTSPTAGALVFESYIPAGKFGMRSLTPFHHCSNGRFTVEGMIEIDGQSMDVRSSNLNADCDKEAKVKRFADKTVPAFDLRDRTDMDGGAHEIPLKDAKAIRNYAPRKRSYIASKPNRYPLYNLYSADYPFDGNAPDARDSGWRKSQDENGDLVWMRLYSGGGSTWNNSLRREPGKRFWKAPSIPGTAYWFPDPSATVRSIDPDNPNTPPAYTPSAVWNKTLIDGFSSAKNLHILSDNKLQIKMKIKEPKSGSAIHGKYLFKSVALRREIAVSMSYGPKTVMAFPRIPAMDLDKKNGNLYLIAANSGKITAVKGLQGEAARKQPTKLYTAITNFAKSFNPFQKYLDLVFGVMEGTFEMVDSKTSVPKAGQLSGAVKAYQSVTHPDGDHEDHDEIFQPYGLGSTSGRETAVAYADNRNVGTQVAIVVELTACIELYSEDTINDGTANRREYELKLEYELGRKCGLNKARIRGFWNR